MYSALLKLVLGVALLQTFIPVSAQTPPLQITPADQASKLLPNRLGAFKAAGVASSLKPELLPAFLPRAASDFGEISAASRRYTSTDGQRFLLTIIATKKDSNAYALLTNAKRSLDQSRSAEHDYPPASDVGTASFLFPDKLLFVKGPALVVVNREDATTRDPQPPVDIARAFAETLDGGEGEIPVLVKHLPAWQNVKGDALYAVSLDTLKTAFNNQSVFDALSFEGGAEAVSARYHGQLVIVEFNTPQVATDNDQRITAKLQELRNQGQPVPTAYRRVGNYLVFVFDAPSQEAANALIDQVKYEQMVQWLGENPYLYERALREFSETTLGVFVNVVKGSGLALISCFLVGGLFGGLLFIRRRAQQRAVEAYSDSGGLVRLNLDEMTPEIQPARLLGRGK